MPDHAHKREPQYERTSCVARSVLRFANSECPAACWCAAQDHHFFLRASHFTDHFVDNCGDSARGRAAALLLPGVEQL